MSPKRTGAQVSGARAPSPSTDGAQPGEAISSVFPLYDLTREWSPGLSGLEEKEAFP